MKTSRGFIYSENRVNFDAYRIQLFKNWIGDGTRLQIEENNLSIFIDVTTYSF